MFYYLLFYIWQFFCVWNSDNLTIKGTVLVLCSRIDMYLWVIDQCYAKPWGPCISTGSYCSKVYLWLSEAYWRELLCACGSKCPCLAVPKISTDQCLALINWYLNEYWLLWHIVWKVFLRAFRYNLDHENNASIHGNMAKWSLWYKDLG